MRLNWKFLPLAMFVALALGASGCGGISASHTVSPLDFLLPGVMNNAKPPATNAPAVFPDNDSSFAILK